MNRKKSKYSREDIKHIRTLINSIKDKEDYNTIIDILIDNPETIWTTNSRKIVLDLDKLSDPILDRVSKFLNKVNNRRSTEIEVDTDTIPNISNQNGSRAYKLSNYEQNILKQRNLKKAMDGDDEYKAMNFDYQSKSKSKSKSKGKKLTKPVKRSGSKSNRNRSKKIEK